MFGLIHKSSRSSWEYGMAGAPLRLARRHLESGRVQFLLWPMGEQGHKHGYWAGMDRRWWESFSPFEPDLSKK